ncbi:Equilibrative nucleoside transporter 3 [Carabus blaptoides fortunei]
MEENNDAHGYLKLGKTRPTNDFHMTNGFSNLPPPVDKFNFVYFSFILAGIGFLLPYNSFIMAVDYFQSRYPGTTVVFDMSLVYIIVAFFTVLINNLLVETLSLNARISFGYLVSLSTLLFVATCEIWWEAFGTSASYAVNLGAVAVIALGCTVQQSSFYGYTSMLPGRYTQAVMAGESAAGQLASINRVLTKLLLPDQRGSTVVFFAMSVAVVLICAVLHQLVRRTDFAHFYITLCDQAKMKITLEPTEDAGLIDSSEGQYGVLKLQHSPPPTASGSGLSFANPAYEPSAPAPTYKVEDIVIRGGTTKSGGIKKGLQARKEVAAAIHPYMATIGFAYFVTLCLYPGIVSEITSCRLGSWMPVLLMAVFNGADLIGKILAAASWHWRADRLLRCSIARFVFIPLVLLCTAPRVHPFFSSEKFPLLFCLLLGLSNGVLGSVPMIQAPSRVPENHRELTGKYN